MSKKIIEKKSVADLEKTVAINAKNISISLPEKDLLALMKMVFVKNRKWFVKLIQNEFDEEQYLTSLQVRKHLKISKTTLYRYIRDGKLSPIEKNGKSYMFSKREINMFFKK